MELSSRERDLPLVYLGRDRDRLLCLDVCLLNDLDNDWTIFVSSSIRSSVLGEDETPASACTTATMLGLTISETLSAWSANLFRSVTSLMANTVRMFSGSCSMNNVLSTLSLHCPPARFLRRCRKIEGFSSPISFPRRSFLNLDSVVSSSEPINRIFRASYFPCSGGVAIMSETNGSAAVSKFSTTYLNLVSSDVTLDIANAASTCANHRVGLSLQNGGSFTNEAALSVNPHGLSWELSSREPSVGIVSCPNAFGSSDVAGSLVVSLSFDGDRVIGIPSVSLLLSHARSRRGHQLWRLTRVHVNIRLWC